MTVGDDIQSDVSSEKWARKEYKSFQALLLASTISIFSLKYTKQPMKYKSNVSTSKIQILNLKFDRVLIYHNGRNEVKYQLTVK